jgi:hypothetical protein
MITSILPGCLGVAVLFLTTFVSRAAAFSEDFAADPFSRGWEAWGETNLFRWDAAGQRLAVTWDSAQPNSFFSHRLGVTLGTNDAFAFGLDLMLADVQGGVRPPRTGAMQLAFGVLNLARAATNNYARAAGKAFDVLEFDWFPAGELPGFGVIDATVSPTVFNSDGRIATSFTFPLELAAGVTHRIRCQFHPADQTLVTTLISDGQSVLVQPVQLPENFTSFAVDTVAVIAWSEVSSPYDSVLAHGFVDNITVELPEPPIGNITMIGLGSVRFASQVGWRYSLEASNDLQAWGRLTSAAGLGGDLVLSDPRDAIFERQFYRVRAEAE